MQGTSHGHTRQGVWDRIFEKWGFCEQNGDCVSWVRYLAEWCGRLINTSLQRWSLPTSFAALVKGHSCDGLSNQQGQGMPDGAMESTFNRTSAQRADRA
jgi:hypothetical protein